MASCPVKLSLWRGAAGWSLLLAGFAVYPHAPWLFAVFLLASLYFFKGCPACWVSGLRDALRQKKQMQASASAGQGDVQPPAPAADASSSSHPCHVPNP